MQNMGHFELDTFKYKEALCICNWIYVYAKNMKSYSVPVLYVNYKLYKKDW